MPLEKDGPQFPLFHKTWRVSHWQRLHDPDLDIIDDVIAMETHSGSHIDGLGHSWHDGQFYNGFSSDKYASSRGVERLGIENVRHIFGRGVMLDVPAYKGVDHLGPTEPVTADDLDRVAEAQGIEFKPGDVVSGSDGLVQALLLRQGTLVPVFPRARRFGVGMAKEARRGSHRDGPPCV